MSTVFDLTAFMSISPSPSPESPRLHDLPPAWRTSPRPSGSPSGARWPSSSANSRRPPRMVPHPNRLQPLRPRARLSDEPDPDVLPGEERASWMDGENLDPVESRTGRPKSPALRRATRPPVSRPGDSENQRRTPARGRLCSSVAPLGERRYADLPKEGSPRVCNQNNRCATADPEPPRVRMP